MKFGDRVMRNILWCARMCTEAHAWDRTGSSMNERVRLYDPLGR